jgi:hypothetical protein
LYVCSINVKINKKSGSVPPNLKKKKMFRPLKKNIHLVTLSLFYSLVDTYAANTTTSWFRPPRLTRRHRLENVKFSISKTPFCKQN